MAVSIGFGGSFFKSRELRAVIGDENGEQTRGLRCTRILAYEVFAAGRFEKGVDTAGAEAPRRTTGATVRRPNGVNPLN
jgi:hypothetical protein